MTVRLKRALRACPVRCIALVILAEASLAACSGSGGSAGPIITPKPTVTASPEIIPFTAATTQPVTGAGTPIPEPAASADFASLAALLVAAQPVPAGQAGVFGVIAATDGTTLSVTQGAAVASIDANGNAPDFVQNYASVGTPGGAVTVTLAPGGVVGSPGGFANLQAGQTIVAGGTANGTRLAATYIGVFGAATASAPAGKTRAPIAAASLRKVAAAAVPQGWVSAAGALTASAGIAGVVRIPGTTQLFTSGSYPCFIRGANSKNTGMATFALTADAALALPQATANFPYRIDNNPSPPAYSTTGGVTTGPGPATDWLEFAALPGTTSAPTYDVLFRADASYNVTVSDSCSTPAKIYTLLGGTIGYGYESATQMQLPSVNQTITLTPVKCIDVNVPLHFTIPLPGLAGLNPFGSSQAGLSVCGTPILGGGYVTGTPGNLQQASSSGGQFIFDPSQTGSASISSAPTLNATGPKMSFSLPLQEQITYSDSTTIEYSLFGQCVIGLPSCSSSGGAGPNLLGTFNKTLTSQSPPTIALQGAQYATCSATDPVSVLNQLPPSTNCDINMVVTAIGGINAVFTVSNLPYGTYTWNAAAVGGLANLTPACNDPRFTPHYMVSPASATGTSVTFTFTHIGPAVGSGQSTCFSTVTDQNGNAVLWAPGQPVEPSLLVVPYG